MPRFSSAGIDIAYRDLGAGDPILLIHGFASNATVNWVSTGWSETLTGDGRRVIAMDVRGHGGSSKFYEPADYRLRLMAADAADLLDHLDIGRVDVMGYSMGARIATVLTVDRPDLTRSLVIGGMGEALVTGNADAEAIAESLEADGDDAVVSPVGAGYRTFARRTGSDLRALAECMRGQRTSISPEHLSDISAPALVAVGTEDKVAGSAKALASAIPGAKVLDIVGRDHMQATGDRQFKAGVLAFLARRP